MQNVIAFYHDKDIDMLKVDYTLSNLTKISLYKSTDKKCYFFTEADKDLVEKTGEDLVSSPFIAFTRKAAVYETFIRKSEQICCLH